MTSDYDLARALFPKAADVVAEATAGVPKTSQVRGYATSDSADGSVTIVLYTDAGGDTAEMEVPTAGGITEGSEVIATLLDGTPVDVVQAGSIDAANAATDAVRQYFWHDSDGAHVATTEGDATVGPNTIIDSGGMAVRDGTTELATFGASTIELGKNSTSSTVELCGGKARINYQTGNSTVVVASQSWEGLMLYGGTVMAKTDAVRLMDGAEAEDVTIPISDLIAALTAPIVESTKSVSVATATNTTLTSITLAAGTWLITQSVLFAANGSGRRVVYVDTSSTVSSVSVAQDASVVQEASAGATKTSGSAIVSPTASTTYYLRCWQNSGSTLTVDGHIKAVRLA